MSDIASLIHGLVRACGPVTLHDITRELRVQSVTWETLIPFERDIAVAEAINGMIRDGKIEIEIDLDSREVSFDQPADAVQPVTAQVIKPGIYEGPRGQSIDVSKLNLPATVPLAKDGTVIGSAAVHEDGMAEISVSAKTICGHCGREVVTIGQPCPNCGDVAECAE